MVLSEPVPKKSDVDAPVSFPPKEAEVARKVDRARCCTCHRLPVSRRDDCMIGPVAAGGTVVGASVFVTAMCLGAFFGGVSGMLVGGGPDPILRL